MRAKAIAAVLALGVVAALALPGGAAAAVRHYRQDPEVFTSLELAGSNGFTIDVVSYSDDLGTMFVSKRPSTSGSEAVVYASLGHGVETARLEKGQLDLSFGHLGHFRGRFVTKSTKTIKPRRGCTGEPTIEEDGAFVGSLDFHGERGYTDVHASRASATLTRPGAQRCVERTERRHPGREKKRRIRAEREREGEFRLLAGREAGNETTLQATRQEYHGGRLPEIVTMNVSTNEKVGALTVFRFASVITLGTPAATIFQIPNLAEPLAETTLRPPAPFSGSATFSSTSPGSATWTGDLAVSLPGTAPLPLTGHGIAAGACQGASDCTKTLPKNLQPALEEMGGEGSFFVGTVTTTVGLPN